MDDILGKAKEAAGLALYFAGIAASHVGAYLSQGARSIAAGEPPDPKETEDEELPETDVSSGEDGPSARIVSLSPEAERMIEEGRESLRRPVPVAAAEPRRGSAAARAAAARGRD